MRRWKSPLAAAVGTILAVMIGVPVHLSTSATIPPPAAPLASQPPAALPLAMNHFLVSLPNGDLLHVLPQVREQSAIRAGQPSQTTKKPNRPTTAAVVPTINYWNHEPPEQASGKVVVLTFDDGPSPWTASLIRTLDLMHVPAVFFWNTQNIHYANEQVQDALAASPSIHVGDHTVDHPNLLKLNAQQQYREIVADQTTLTKLLGKPVTLFRPPYGNYNATTIRILQQAHLTPVLWNVDSLDWKFNSNEQGILRTIQSEVKPQSIILMHDHRDTIRFLPDIIRMLQRDGYQFTMFRGV